MQGSAKGLLEIRPSPHSSPYFPPLTKVLWQVSCWWHHRCWIICQKPLLADLHPLWLSCNRGHLRPKERRGAPGGERASMRAANRQEVWGPLLRAGTSDPCVGFVCADDQRVLILPSAWEDVYYRCGVFVCMNIYSACDSLDFCFWTTRTRAAKICMCLKHAACQKGHISRILVCGAWIGFITRQ